MTAHAAYLRVYEPLAAFDEEQRRHWEAYAASGRARSPAAGTAREREEAVRALVAGRVPDLAEEAYVAEVDAVTLICPWQTRVRALQALEEFVAEVPAAMLDAWLPRAVVDAAAEELGALRRRTPELRTHQLTSTWHVPLRWFVLVDSEEREVHRAGRSNRLAGRGLVYRTPMSQARRRVARALAVLRRAIEDGVITAGVEDLGRWLEEFHPRSLVELDYGGLVHLLDDAELGQDESARDIALALAALGDGDTSRAGAAYERVTARMKALQAVESAN
jgi:hypothetical protein